MKKRLLILSLTLISSASMYAGGFLGGIGRGIADVGEVAGETVVGAGELAGDTVRDTGRVVTGQEPNNLRNRRQARDYRRGYVNAQPVNNGRVYNNQ